MLLALAASKDSRHMRTIALVTMVFLPGTFFAVSYSAYIVLSFEETNELTY